MSVPIFAQPTYVGMVLGGALLAMESARDGGVSPGSQSFKAAATAIAAMLSSMGVDDDSVRTWIEIATFPNDQERKQAVTAYCLSAQRIAKESGEKTVWHHMSKDRYVEVVDKAFADAQAGVQLPEEGDPETGDEPPASEVGADIDDPLFTENMTDGHF